MKHLVITITTFVLLIYCSCSDNGTQPPQIKEQRDSLTLSIVQVTNRSVSLHLKKILHNSKDHYVINRIYQTDTSSFLVLNSTFTDTVIIDDNDGTGLQLDTDYGYFAYRLDSTGSARDSSMTVSAHTLPATSHNFSWTEYTLAGFPTAELDDVWGTDENNVYAVGGVETDSGFYSIFHWDGVSWTSVTDNAGGSSIFGFSGNDIWVAGGGVAHFNGYSWEWVDHYSQNNQSFPKDKVLYDNTPYTSIWGTSSSNLYFGTQRGKIIYWDGTKATESPVSSDYPFRAIWGLSENNIWAVAGTVSGGNFGEIYHFNGKQWSLVAVSQSGQLPRGALVALWAADPFQILVAGNLLFPYSPSSGQWSQVNVNFFTERIYGAASNDVFAVGDYGGIAHFNGEDWYTFEDIPVRGQAMVFTGVWAVNNHVFCVGTHGYIYIGQR